MEIITKKMKETAEEVSSAQSVASVDDLLVQVLLPLPIKSLVRFKAVSQHWLSLIADPQFVLRRSPNPNPAVGLFLPSRRSHRYDYIPFDVHNQDTPPPFKIPNSTEDESSISIVQSCNGLLLCAAPGFESEDSQRNYYVYNPTTKGLTKLPNPRRGPGALEVFRGVTLAFDPTKSPHYKVVCVRDSGIRPAKFQVEIYSSEKGSWRTSGSGPFNVDMISALRLPEVYWNGAAHWICPIEDMNSNLYFNVDEERLGVIPTLPPTPHGWYWGRNVNYFGESCDHLHLVALYGKMRQFNVYELKRDYSEWFVKYHVDLAEVATVFNSIVMPSDSNNYYYLYSILSIIRGGKEDDAFLVLRILGKIIRYNLVSKTFQKLCDFKAADKEEEHYSRWGGTIITYQYIQSLLCV